MKTILIIITLCLPLNAVAAELHIPSDPLARYWVRPTIPTEAEGLIMVQTLRRDGGAVSLIVQLCDYEDATYRVLNTVWGDGAVALFTWENTSVTRRMLSAYHMVPVQDGTPSYSIWKAVCVPPVEETIPSVAVTWIGL